MKNSLIGQLASFALAIIGGVLGVINTIRTEIQRRAMELLMKSGGPDAEELERMAALKKQRQLEVFRETIQFFAMNSAQIEVVRNDKLQRIQFYKLPYCHYLPDESKVEFHDLVVRDSPNAKV